MKEAIHTAQAPAAIGPYSQAIRANGFVFVSGQLPVDPATGSFAGADVTAQTRQSLQNIQSIMDAVVKTTVFLQNMGDFAAMNEVYAAFFTGACPARAAVQVAALPKGALVEIEAIAAV